MTQSLPTDIIYYQTPSGYIPAAYDLQHLLIGGTKSYQNINHSIGGGMAGNINMMIVDDSPRARMALTACLSLQSSVKIIAQAANGAEAIQLISNQVPDVILMDMKMPVMNGLEATRIIKKNWPQVVVIILSMYSDYLAEALESGADRFLVKGCSMEEMMSAVTALVR